MWIVNANLFSTGLTFYDVDLLHFRDIVLNSINKP